MAIATQFRTSELSIGEKIRGLHWPIILLTVLLGIIGYGVLFSAGGGSHEPWAWRHATRLSLGLVVLLVIALIDIRIWFRWAYVIYGGAFVLLLGVEILGTLSNGAQRWINIGFIQLQPSEIMKVALIIALARYFHSGYLEDTKRVTFLVVPVLIVVLPAAMVLRQPDLGTAVMLVSAGIAMLFLGGVRIWKFMLGAAICAGALPVVWSALHDYQRDRVMTFLNPEGDPLGTGYHIIQSKIALGSGGLWGRGFLNGTQAQLSFLPEKQTDFAFTMLAEETGLVGALLLLALFLALILMGLLVSMRANSHFSRLLAAGLSFNLFLYVVINVSMVTGLIPVVGVPLPLISYGGTAMLTVMVGLGLVLSADLHGFATIPRFPVDL